MQLKIDKATSSDVSVAVNQTEVNVQTGYNISVEVVPTSRTDVVIDRGIIGPAGPGVPTGGTVNQILTKSSSTDYDDEWLSYATLDYLQLNTAQAQSIALGKLRWNLDTATASFGIIDGTVEVNIGEQMYAYVTNADSVTIQKGQPVYLYGATGNRASVKLASNLGDPTSAKTLGLATQNIAPNQIGFITTQGVLDKINTSAFAEGDTLYLGATAGTLTNVKPQAPNHLVYIGVVERANNGNGQIYIRPQNGYELDELHDVQITNPLNGQTVVRDSSTSLWKNSFFPRVLPRVLSVTSASTITPNADNCDQYDVTALATNLTIDAPTGTPYDAQKLILRIKDNGTARTLTWTTGVGHYRAIGLDLPTVTLAGQVLYVGIIYNSQDLYWDIIAVAQQS